eukprot:scaffold3679_cov116-Isochrysis_galbana.AAC.3
MISRPRDTLVLARSLHSAPLAFCALPVACPLARAPAGEVARQPLQRVDGARRADLGVHRGVAHRSARQ